MIHFSEAWELSGISYLWSTLMSLEAAVISTGITKRRISWRYLASGLVNREFKIFLKPSFLRDLVLKIHIYLSLLAARKFSINSWLLYVENERWVFFVGTALAWRLHPGTKKARKGNVGTSVEWRLNSENDSRLHGQPSFTRPRIVFSFPSLISHPGSDILWMEMSLEAACTNIRKEPVGRQDNSHGNKW